MSAVPRWLPAFAMPLAALALAAVALALGLQLAARAEGPAAGQLILVGMILVIGAFAGRVAGALGLPRLTGYLLAGVALSPSLWTWLGHPGLFGTTAQLATLAPANDLAVGVIALMAGSEIEARWLRTRLRVLLAVAGAEALIVPTILAAVLLVVPDVPFMSQAVAAGVPVLLVALLAGVVLLPNGPTVVITVLAETGANGPLARMLLGASVILDALVILGFTLVVSLIDSVAGPEARSLGAAFAAAMGGMAGSLLLGGALGWGLRRYAERTGHRLAWLVLGIALAVAALGVHAGIKPLFCLLAAGFAFGNLPGADPTRAALAHARLHATLAQVGMPVFVVFFTAAGLKVDLLTLAASWGLVLGLLILRDGLIIGAIRLGTATAITRIPVEPAVRRHLWVGMVSQAGVTLALVQIVRDHFPGWGDTVATFVVAMVTLHELWVPVVLVRALRQAGEGAR